MGAFIDIYTPLICLQLFSDSEVFIYVGHPISSDNGLISQKLF